MSSIFFTENAIQLEVNNEENIAKKKNHWFLDTQGIKEEIKKNQTFFLKTLNMPMHIGYR